jgi:phenylpyruvate tautomerase PptA (4-oxalocrotonate tautomerase family)
MKSFLFLLCLFPLLAFAELPPSAYENMQAKAPEYLKIEVLRVDVAPGSTPEEQNVHVVALVTQVMRTAADVKPDDIINILYTVTERPKGWVGPGAIPVLEDKQQTVAYLSKGETGDFKPEAGRMSFSNF